jgi:hypothetical protein
LGDQVKAFEFLEKAYRERCADLPYVLRADLRVDRLRSELRLQDLIHRMNFEIGQVWSRIQAIIKSNFRFVCMNKSKEERLV